MERIIEIDGFKFKEYEVDTGTQIAIVRERIPTEEELKQQAEFQRGETLKKIIADKQLIGEDVSAEIEELKALSLGNHDDYIADIKTQAIDNYTLGLITEGVL